MLNRFALRFENGERSGEILPIPSGGMTLGRRPGNSVQILDASVSGRHAELSVDGEGVTARDLGSTNGTRVGGTRISQQRLCANDELLVGNVRFTFLDSDAAPGDLAHSDTGEINLEDPDDLAPAPAPAAVPAAPLRSAPRPSPRPAEAPAPARAAVPAAPAAGEAGEEVQTIAAEKVARTRSKPLAAALALVLIVGGGGTAAWYFTHASAQPGQRAAVRAVEAVAGDLLAAGYSFESELGGWEGDPRAPAGFAADSSARHSGELGLEAALDAGSEDGQAWALEQSPLVRIGVGRSLRAQAWVEAEDGAEILLGVRLESSTDAALASVLWDAPRGPGAGGDIEFLVDVPGVYDTARALLLARLRPGETSGTARADDVSLVAVPSPGGRPKLGETELYFSGSAAVLFKIDHALLSDISVHAPGRRDDPSAPRAALAVEPKANGLRLWAPGASGPLALSFFVEPGLAAGGLASMGEGGYRTHQVDFERAGAEALLLGSGGDLVRIACATARKVLGRPAGGGFLIEIEYTSSPEAFVQVSFREERDSAQVLARQARRAEEQGQLGAALTAWGQLLDKFPYEEDLVREAGATRGRLEQAGHAELRVLNQRLERARFFRLLDIFRRCRDDALVLAARYTPSSVADDANALAKQVEADASGLLADLEAAERARLAAIEAALRESGSVKLAERIRARLDEMSGTGH